MNKTDSSAPSLHWMASTATKSSVSGILSFRKSKHVERNKTAESGHPLPSLLFLDVENKSCFLLSIFLFFFDCFFLCISPEGRVMLRFPAFLAALHADQRKKLLARNGNRSPCAIRWRFARPRRRRDCGRGLLRPFRCAHTRETWRERRRAGS